MHDDESYVRAELSSLTWALRVLEQLLEDGQLASVAARARERELTLPDPRNERRTRASGAA